MVIYGLVWTLKMLHYYGLLNCHGIYWHKFPGHQDECTSPDVMGTSVNKSHDSSINLLLYASQMKLGGFHRVLCETLPIPSKK